MNETNHSNFEIDNYKRAIDLLTHKINLRIQDYADKVYMEIKEKIHTQIDMQKTTAKPKIKGKYELTSLIDTGISKDEYKEFFYGYYVKTNKFVFKQRNGKEHLFVKFKDIVAKRTTKDLIIKILLFAISSPLLGVFGFLYKRKAIVISGDLEFTVFSDYLKKRLDANGIISYITQESKRTSDNLKREKLVLYYKSK